MDIKPPASLSSPALAIGNAVSGALSLKLNQLIQARVLETQLSLNLLTLRIGEQTLSLQSNRPLPIAAGQLLAIQVDKLTPQLEFKVLSPAAGADTRLTVLAKPAPIPPGPVNVVESRHANLNGAPRFSATVISVTPEKILLLPTSGIPLAAQSLATSPAKADQVKLLTLMPEQLRLAVEESPSASKPTSSQITRSSANLQPLQQHPPLLQPGMKVALQPLTSEIQPSFALFPPETLENTDATQLQELRNRLLPQSLPAPALMQHLAKLALVNPNIDMRIGEVLRGLAQAILRELPMKSQLTDARSLRQQVVNSGLFLEGKLLALLRHPQDDLDSSQLRQDLKFKLDRFAGEIVKLIAQSQPDAESPSPELSLLKETLDKVQGTLIKQTLDQLNSLPRDDSNRQTWLIELPFHNPPHIDRVSIEIEQDRGKDSDSKPNDWAVSIVISPPDLGTIHCRLSCYGGSINTRFWSESPRTVEKLNSNMAHLKQQFEDKGLVAGFMEAQPGKPSGSDHRRQTPASLLSIKA